jgi:hypothetical protein
VDEAYNLQDAKHLLLLARTSSSKKTCTLIKRISSTLRKTFKQRTCCFHMFFLEIKKTRDSHSCGKACICKAGYLA